MAGFDGEDDDLDIEIGGGDNTDAGGGEASQPGDDGDDGSEPGETVIAFADEGEDGEDDLADIDEKAQRLIRDLRGKLRESNGKVAKLSRNPAPANDTDPEPQVPDEPGDLEAFDYDEARQREAWRAFNVAKQKHVDWQARQKDRDAERSREAEKQAKAIEQQRNSLGVADYEDRANAVKDRLSDAQMAVLINGAQNPAKLIYALGRSPSKLEQIAAEGNLARFAMLAGSMERDIKVTKRAAPAVDTRVRGATASARLPAADRELQRLEKEAERTNDRTAINAYKRKLREEARNRAA